MARPTKIESLKRKIEAATNSINEKAADAIVDMYEVIESVARNDKATDASRMSAAKWVIERAEEVLGDDAKEGVSDSDSDTTVKTNDYFSTTYQEESRKH